MVREPVSAIRGRRRAGSGAGWGAGQASAGLVGMIYFLEGGEGHSVAGFGSSQLQLLEPACQTSSPETKASILFFSCAAP